MKFRLNPISTLAISLAAICFLGCNSKPSVANKPVQSPTPTPTPKPKPFIAYLKAGDLWVIRSDGSDERMLAVAAQGQAIQDFVWSADGSKIYYVVGFQFYGVTIADGNVAETGALVAPPGVTIDHIELARDGQSFAVVTTDANTQQRLYAVTIGQNEARELAIDQYNGLIPQRPPAIRAVGEMAVSPNGEWVLFKDSVGAGEELFVSSIETGARVQITNLYQLSGFEESVETEGGRRVMEAAWSSDGRYVVFNPMQYCSEIGLCSGRLFLVEAFGGPQLQLSIEMMVNVPNGWNSKGNLLIYDDGSQVVVADTQGVPNALTEGHHPKWQPSS